MSVPTRQQLDIVSNAAQAASDAQKALLELQSFLTSLSVNPFTASVGTADFSTAASGSLQGFDPTVFAAFTTEAQALITLILANNQTIANAFGAMAAWKS